MTPPYALSRRRRPRWRLAALLLSAHLAVGCAVDGLAFRQDDRVSITRPATNEEVSLPFEVDWTVSDYEGRFAVFFDRTPMGRDDTLLSLVPDTDPCRRDPGCPTEEWLLRHNIYVVDHGPVLIETLPDLRDNGRQKDRHELYVVFLDSSGRRDGEATFVQEFIVERGGA